jgi:nephrocystin-4
LKSLKLDQVIPDYSSDTSSTPFILKHVEHEQSNVRPESETPGYMISYSVDPTNLKFGEKRMFLHYLANHAMFIDVWDADSLHLIGTATMQMKDLLRHGKEAVQSTFELDIIKTEYDDHDRLYTHDTVKK